MYLVSKKVKKKKGNDRNHSKYEYYKEYSFAYHSKFQLQDGIVSDIQEKCEILTSNVIMLLKFKNKKTNQWK